MDAQQIRPLRPKLTRFLRRLDDCFPRRDTRAHPSTYVQGQRSELPDKSVEPIAVKAGVPPRTLQEFLSQHRWDEDRMRDQVQPIVRTEHSGVHRMGILDETSFVKKGDQTPGVPRPWCGTSGQKDNGAVTVHLAYACEDFHALSDGERSLPESGSEDRERCREAGIPDGMTYRPKWRIGLERYDQAVGNGLSFDWFTFDEGYGGKPDFLRGLPARRRFVGEAPRRFTGWLKAARVVTRPSPRRRRGWGRRIPRLASGSRPAVRVEDLLKRAEFQDRLGQRGRVKDGDKGPMIGEVKHARFHPQDDNGRPAGPLHLLVARNVLDPEEVRPVLRQPGGRAGPGRANVVGGLLALAGGALIAALIPGGRLEQRPSAKLVERTAAEIHRTQQRITAARKSHTKRTRKRLRELGIKLTALKRCKGGRT